MPPMHSTAPTLVYKVCPGDAWREAVTQGHYLGSADDIRDGFIHLSTREQLAGTLSKYFRGQGGLVLVQFAAEELGQHLHWEPSRGGALFPHYYGPLPAGRARTVTRLVLDADDIPQLPEEA